MTRSAGVEASLGESETHAATIVICMRTQLVLFFGVQRINARFVIVELFHKYIMLDTLERRSTHNTMKYTNNPQLSHYSRQCLREVRTHSHWGHLSDMWHCQACRRLWYNNFLIKKCISTLVDGRRACRHVNVITSHEGVRVFDRGVSPDCPATGPYYLFSRFLVVVASTRDQFIFWVILNLWIHFSDRSSILLFSNEFSIFVLLDWFHKMTSTPEIEIHDKLGCKRFSLFFLREQCNHYDKGETTSKRVSSEPTHMNLNIWTVHSTLDLDSWVSIIYLQKKLTIHFITINLHSILLKFHVCKRTLVFYQAQPTVNQI
jgi:hypothetical protein